MMSIELHSSQDSGFMLAFWMIAGSFHAMFHLGVL